jgi:hypothetical protein
MSDWNTQRRKVLALLEAWSTGELDEEAVRDRAELLEFEDDIDQPVVMRGEEVLVDESDPRSIGIEALARLATMHVSLLTREDIPALVAFVRTQEDQTAAGWAAFRAHDASIDYEERARQLSGSSFYLTR